MPRYVRPLTPDEIYHHGVQGQKWGVRRYQNSDGSLTSAGRKHQAKIYTKTLNKTDQNIAMDTRRYRDAQRMQSTLNKQYNKRAEKLTSKNKDLSSDKKLSKTKMQIDAQKKIENESLKKIVSGNKEVNRILKEVNKNGYSVKARETMRDVETKGEKAAKMAVRTLAAMGGVYTFGGGTYVQGTSYKVRNPKEK